MNNMSICLWEGSRWCWIQKLCDQTEVQSETHHMLLLLTSTHTHIYKYTFLHFHFLSYSSDWQHFFPSSNTLSNTYPSHWLNLSILLSTHILTVSFSSSFPLTIPQWQALLSLFLPRFLSFISLLPFPHWQAPSIPPLSSLLQRLIPHFFLFLAGNGSVHPFPINHLLHLDKLNMSE